MGKGGMTKFQLVQRLKKISDMHLQGIEVEEIAKGVGVSEQTVYSALRKQKKEWEERIEHNTNIVMAETLAETDLLKKEYWEAWRQSQTTQQIKTRKVNQRAEKPKKGKKAEGDAGGNESASSLNQVVEISETMRERDGNPSFLKGVEWCLNFKVELLGLKKINLELGGDIEVEIEA